MLNKRLPTRNRSRYQLRLRRRPASGVVQDEEAVVEAVAAAAEEEEGEEQGEKAAVAVEEGEEVAVVVPPPPQRPDPIRTPGSGSAFSFALEAAHRDGFKQRKGRGERMRRQPPVSVHTFQDVLGLVRRRVDEAEVGEVSDRSEETRLLPPLGSLIIFALIVVFTALLVLVLFRLRLRIAAPASIHPSPLPLLRHPVLASTSRALPDPSFLLPILVPLFHLVRSTELKSAPPLAKVRQSALRMRVGISSIRDCEVVLSSCRRPRVIDSVRIVAIVVVVVGANICERAVLL